MKVGFQVKTAINNEDFMIEETLELSKSEYKEFASNISADYDFIKERSEWLNRDNKTRKCLLVLCEGEDDGVLITLQGESHRVYSSELLNARQIIALWKYPQLKEFVDVMQDTVEHYTRQAIDLQEKGEYRMAYHWLKEYSGIFHLDREFLLKMFRERSEFSWVDEWGNGFDVKINEAYVKTRKQKRQLSQGRVDEICHSHSLWVNGRGGNRADFSHGILKDIDLSNQELSGANFSDAVLNKVLLSGANLSNANFHNARVYDCKGVLAEVKDVDFVNAKFFLCDWEGTNFQGGDFTNTSFVLCDAGNATMSNCCLERANLGDMSCATVDMEGVSYNQEEWQNGRYAMRLGELQ